MAAGLSEKTCLLDRSLCDRIAANLAAFGVCARESAGRARAAVAFALVDCSEPAAIANIPHRAEHAGEAAFILTTRAPRLSSHAGQRAYPGGRIDPGETAEQAALRELLRADAPILEPIAESANPVLKMPLGDEWFAAPSAAIAYQFREVALLGRGTRVAHFEQPYFAWR